MSEVNTVEYWNDRFTKNWDERGGRQQSRSFMELLVRSLPLHVAAEIVDHRLELMDCGCAKGDGTTVLVQRFPNSKVSGFDFSKVAISEAQATYPDVDYFVSDFLTLDREADVLISSHCFEHLEDPLRALHHLTRKARRYVVLLLPFRERFPGDSEHRWIVHAQTYPETLGRWDLTFRAALPPIPVWRQSQVLLIFEPRKLAGRKRAKLLSAGDLDVVSQLLCIAVSLQELEGRVESIAQRSSRLDEGEAVEPSSWEGHALSRHASASEGSSSDAQEVGDSPMGVHPEPSSRE